MDEYEKLSYVYENLATKDEIFKQRDFFKNLLDKFSINSCLDCACGVGWHLYLLNDLGIKCSGSDLSKEMISIAAKNLQRKKISLKQGDYRKLKQIWNTKFDMIICMSTSFNHMMTKENALEALNSMFNQLNNKGILVIVNGASDKLLISHPKFIPVKISKKYAFFYFLEYMQNNLILFNIIYIEKTKDSFKHQHHPVILNALTKNDFKEYFRHTDFKKINYYGNFDYSKYSPKTSDRLIVIAQK
jgi:glycine/sarcosine N-methyltransferase